MNKEVKKVPLDEKTKMPLMVRKGVLLTQLNDLIPRLDERQFDIIATYIHAGLGKMIKVEEGKSDEK